MNAYRIYLIENIYIPLTNTSTNQPKQRLICVVYSEIVGMEILKAFGNVKPEALLFLVSVLHL